jgi:hypothetical protein
MEEGHGLPFHGIVAQRDLSEGFGRTVHYLHPR